MKVPFSWLKEFVDIDVTAQELEEKLFSCGFEVEELIPLDAGISKVVVGKIVEMEKQEGTHLTKCVVDCCDYGHDIRISTGAANMKLGDCVPDSILPSITRRSLVYVAKEYLGLEVEEREVYLDEVKDFAEAGLCGTAAVISPVGKIVDHGKEICLPSGMTEMGPVTKKLYETLTGIQMGRIEAPKGWIHVIE